MKRLRILHTEASQGWGGQEIRILTEASGMLARGHAVTVLSCPQSNIDRVARERSIPAVALPIGMKRFGAFKAMRTWLAAHRREFDIINTHSSTDSWLVALSGATLAGVPPVVRTRHLSTNVHNNRATRWLYLHSTAHIVTTGEQLRQQLHRDNRFPLSRMTSVPTGIELGRYRPGEARAARAALGLRERHTLGIVATLRLAKGHADLLDAWVTLGERTRDWQLVVLGDGPQRANIEARVARLGLGDAVILAGNRDDVERWLPAFDIFVLPSHAEGVPQGIMQAMAAGLPVISTTVGSIGEAVVDGETGILVKPRDIGMLAAALSRVMDDAGLRARLGAAGLARAQAKFGAEQMLDAMEAVFAEVIRERS
jgi:glycosyltransferase involved in cell wall biosynthesis